MSGMMDSSKKRFAVRARAPSKGPAVPLAWRSGSDRGLTPDFEPAPGHGDERHDHGLEQGEGGGRGHGSGARERRRHNDEADADVADGSRHHHSAAVARRAKQP